MLIYFCPPICHPKKKDSVSSSSASSLLAFWEEVSFAVPESHFLPSPFNSLKEADLRRQKGHPDDSLADPPPPSKVNPRPHFSMAFLFSDVAERPNKQTSRV